jgi:hypothetical protein
MNWYQNIFIIVSVITLIALIGIAYKRQTKQDKSEDKINHSVYTPQYTPTPTPPPPQLPYLLKNSCLTATEQKFFETLYQHISNDLLIFPKVGLKDIFYIPRNHPDYMSYFGKIAQKHVDFLICNRSTLTPVCAIEIDDSSHNQYKTQQRDNFVNSVYRLTNLPLIRLQARYNYTRQNLLPLFDYLKTENTTSEAKP